MQVYLNGEWIPAEEARVSVFDRGFVFGDSIYEVIPVYGYRPFRVAAHITRLKASLAAVGMDAQPLKLEWDDLFNRLAETMTSADGSIYLQISRGTAPRQHRFPANAPLTVFAYAHAHSPSTGESSDGIRAILHDDIRWARCDIKSTSLIANVLLVQVALEQGADEALLVRDGLVNEGAVSNVFAVRAGRLFTAPRSHFILGGVTRDLLLELAARCAIPAEERAPTRAELLGADEVMITSSSREVVAVTHVDMNPIGDGRPGPVFRQLHKAFQEFKDGARKGLNT
ncbi:MAG TPA: aminotransferase class IV [Acidiferrobacter sp.]|nr:aminotransferase class IV [Acidiferrobacter sp.]